MRFNTRFVKVLLVAIFPGLLFGCRSDDNVYTLYRTSIVGDLRVHIATFDAAGESGSYNRENCFTAQNLYERQPGVLTKFWCEKGRYKN